MTTDHRYDLVSSLYGPGTTACWLLTVVACCVSWTLHLKKSHSDSIDADFIVLLTFPAVAAAHLISQVHTYPLNQELSMAADEVRLLQLNAAIEASLNIIETSMEIFVLLFIIAAVFHSVKRGLLIALIGLFCFAAEGYLYVTNSAIRQTKGNLSRSFLVDFTEVLIFILILLTVLVTAAFVLMTLYYISRRQSTGNVREDLEILRANQETDTRFNSWTIVSLTFLFLPLTFVASTVPITTDILSIRASDLTTWLQATWHRLLEDFFPRTSLSITDLDQAVAFLAGATVLGFSLHSAAHSRYHEFCEASRIRREAYSHRLLLLRRQAQVIQDRSYELAQPLPIANRG